MLFYTRRCVGIAIGQHMTHIVELYKKRRHIHIGLIAVSKRSAENVPALVALKHCQSRRAVISIPESCFRRKAFSVDSQLNDLQIERDLQNNLHRYFPRNTAGDFFDFHQTTNNALHVVVAKRDFIIPLLEVTCQPMLRIQHIRITGSYPRLSQRPNIAPEFFNAYALSLQGLS